MLCFAGRIDTRTISALDPVESVSRRLIGITEFSEGMCRFLAKGVFQWSIWPTMSRVSGRMPWRTTARPVVSPTADSTVTSSPSAIPISAALVALMTTPLWVSTFSAASRMSGIWTLAPQLYCMERVVSSQKG